MELFIIHIKTLDDDWVVLRPTTGKPYSYTSAKRAWEIADMCYPDHCRSMRLGGEECVRVTKVSPEKYFELFGLEADPAKV